MQLDRKLLLNLTNFRRQLHKFPELSGEESETQKKILNFLSTINPDNIIKNIGGYGLAYVFDSGKPGNTVLFRGDMDALPISESNTFDYKSENEGVAHLCGHDGHMAVLSGLAHLIDKNPPDKGRAVLLFQPAEETGEGAELVVNDKKFEAIKPDYSFAFHNLPGFKKNAICIKNGPFASASTGMIIDLKGLSSHAAHPEDGNNPDKCIAELITEINKISDSINSFKDFILITIIHIKLGEVAFGTTPGKAVVMATLRTFRNDDMDMLQNEMKKLIKRVAEKHKINYNISFTEEFPACFNNDDAYKIVRNAVTNTKADLVELEKPFRWSEDFGHFSLLSKATIFGIGSGVSSPQLHNEDYDFPDEIIEHGLKVFFDIYKQLHF